MMLSTWTYLWIVLAIVSAIAEVAIPNFAFVFSCLASLVAALAAAVGYRWEIQALGFVAALFLGLFMFRPRVVRRLQSKVHLPSRTDVLIGKRARVSESIEPASGRGRVEIDGLDWAAQATQSIPEGTDVIIEKAEGIVLHVKAGG